MRAHTRISLSCGRMTPTGVSGAALYRKWKNRGEALGRHLEAVHPQRTTPDPECRACREIQERARP